MSTVEISGPRVGSKLAGTVWVLRGSSGALMSPGRAGMAAEISQNVASACCSARKLVFGIRTPGNTSTTTKVRRRNAARQWRIFKWMKPKEVPLVTGCADGASCRDHRPTQPGIVERQSFTLRWSFAVRAGSAMQLRLNRSGSSVAQCEGYPHDVVNARDNREPNRGINSQMFAHMNPSRR